jgi:holo-[acyl-carrier protein] synthase
MARAIGIDLVSVGEVEAAIASHGDRYLARVYTPSERRQCGRDGRRLAARFAVKEATMKVLRRDDEALSWDEIDVATDVAGAPVIELHGLAAQLADARGIISLSASMTRNGSEAAAVVLAELAG